jgi:hypothetical protein
MGIIFHLAAQFTTKSWWALDLPVIKSDMHIDGIPLEVTAFM